MVGMLRYRVGRSEGDHGEMPPMKLQSWHLTEHNCLTHLKNSSIAPWVFHAKCKGGGKYFYSKIWMQVTIESGFLIYLGSNKYKHPLVWILYLVSATIPPKFEAVQV